MNRLTATDLQLLQLAPYGRPEGSKNPIVRELREIAAGESIYFTMDEWNLKTPPSVYVGSYFRKDRTTKRFSVRKTRGGYGYVVTRTN